MPGDATNHTTPQQDKKKQGGKRLKFNDTIDMVFYEKVKCDTPQWAKAALTPAVQHQQQSRNQTIRVCEQQ